MSEELEKTDLKLYEEQFAALQEELRAMDHKAWQALKAVEGKEEVSFDPYCYRQHKEKLQRQLPILETKVRRERDRFLKQRRAEKQLELQELQPELNETKAAYHKAQELLEKAWKAHALLEIKAYNIEEGLRIDYEDLRSNQRALQSLIREITGVNDVVDHNGPSNTDNIY